MVHAVRELSTSLRERKKQHTRARLISAAVELCLKRGYEHTTVEQIALEADVSARTFSRYFATKDAVFLTLIEEYEDQVAAELADVPAGIGPLEALRWAHVTTLTRATKRQTGERIALMLRVINASDALRQAAFDFRHDATHVFLAHRMGLPVDDRRVQLVVAVFSAVIGTACGDLIADVDGTTLGPAVMIDRLNEAFEQLVVLTADVQPPIEERVVRTVNG